MIRRVQFIDVVRRLLSGRRINVDMTYTWESVGLAERRLGLLEIARFGMLPSSSGHTFPLAVMDGNDLKGLAVVRTRSGIRAWELAHMYFEEDVEQEQYLELLRAEACDDGLPLCMLALGDANYQPEEIGAGAEDGTRAIGPFEGRLVCVVIA